MSVEIALNNIGKSGKIRAKRYRLHTSAPKPTETGSEEIPITRLYYSQKNTPVTSNIFKNVVISADALKQKLPIYSKKDERNLEVKSVIKKFTKSEIRRRRKIPFHEVVSSAKDFLRKKEEEKKQKKSSILGNFQALEEALPALDQLMEEKKKDQKPRAAKRFSKQEAEMMEDLQTFQQVLNNPEYAVDPFGTISEHLKQRIQSCSL